MPPLRRRALAALALLAIAIGGVGATASSTSAWFTATRTAAAEVTGATLSIGKIGAEDRRTVTVAGVQPMTDAQAAEGATSEWITVRNTGTVALDWALQIVNPQPGARMTAAQVANFRFRLYDERGLPLTEPLSLGAQPVAAVSGAALTRGVGLAKGGSTRLKIRAWLSTDSGNEFQGAGAAFDVVINAIQGEGGRPSAGPVALTATPTAAGTALRWGDATPQLAAEAIAGPAVYTVERATRADFADAVTVYSGGNRSIDDTSTPATPWRAPAGFTDGATAVSRGDWNTCVATKAGAAVCETNGVAWRTLGGPVAVGGTLAGERVIDVANGSPTCAVTESGRLYCWPPYERSGATAQPVLLNGGALAGKRVVAVSTGPAYDPEGACALTSDGQVACWGLLTPSSSRGAAFATPTSMMTGALAGQRVAELARSRQSTCARTDAGAVACWGMNGYGALGSGDGNTGTEAVSPVAVALPAGATVVAVAGSEFAMCAARSDDAVFCWGDFFTWRALGASPVRMPAGSWSTPGPITDLAVTNAGYCLIRGGAAFCAGENRFGVLGVGAPVPTGYALDGDRIVPQAESVRDRPAIVGGALAGTTVSSISSTGSGWSVCATTSAGRTACWGRLGDSTFRATPVTSLASLPTPVATCVASAALRADGTCTLPLVGDLYYRVTYTSASAPGWRGPAATAVRRS